MEKIAGHFYLPPTVPCVSRGNRIAKSGVLILFYFQNLGFLLEFGIAIPFPNECEKTDQNPSAEVGDLVEESEATPA